MGILGKLLVRCIFCIAIMIIIASGIVVINESLYELFNAGMAVFALMSADILIENYLSRGKDTQ